MTLYVKLLTQNGVELLLQTTMALQAGVQILQPLRVPLATPHEPTKLVLKIEI